MRPYDLSLLFERAEKARIYWQEHSLSEYDSILLLPSTDERLNEIMLSAFEAKLRKIPGSSGRDFPKAAVLSVNPLRESGYFTFIQITTEIAQNILQLYCMYEYSNKIMIGSFDLPYGRKLRNLMNSGISTEMELVDMILSQNEAVQI